MAGDVVVITLPVDGYENVARLVTGGLASRLEFGFEAVDDLQLAVELVLRSLPARSGTVTLSLIDDGNSFCVEIAHTGSLSLRRALQPLDGITVDLGASLERLVDSVSMTDGPSPAILLQKALPVRA